MRNAANVSLLLLSVGGLELFSAEIEGTVIVKRRLSKRKVTAPASAYARGVAVELNRDQDGGILDLERSRVVVYLDGKLPAGSAGAEMVQEGRHFVPDTIAIPVGSSVAFPNRDPIFHNVFSLSKAKSFDLGNYSQNQTRTVHFPQTGIVFVHCHLHPNMTAAVLVAPNRFVTIAGRDGAFHFSNVPPGEYVAVAWHRAAGYFRQTVTVTADNSAAVRFFIPLEAEAPGRTITPE